MTPGFWPRHRREESVGAYSWIRDRCAVIGGKRRAGSFTVPAFQPVYQPAAVYDWDGLRIDAAAGSVTLHGRPVKLTKREWALLLALVKYRGQAAPALLLLQEAWGPEYRREAVYVRSYISRLRRKLEADPKNPRYILSQWGAGYRLAGP